MIFDTRRCPLPASDVYPKVDISKITLDKLPTKQAVFSRSSDNSLAQHLQLQLSILQTPDLPL